ncbi:hypothetical protein Bbelb_156890 [Branchiostoma belcheri]|nr:hypothetical protein Bbelb_156890 [Branchiostoma belcheri]
MVPSRALCRYATRPQDFSCLVTVAVFVNFGTGAEEKGVSSREHVQTRSTVDILANRSALSALAVSSLCALCALSRRSHGVLTALSWCSHGALTVFSRPSHGALTVFSRRSHGALTALSRCSHGALMVLSRRSHGALMALSRRSHGVLTALSRRTHGALTAFSRRSHGAHCWIAVLGALTASRFKIVAEVTALMALSYRAPLAISRHSLRALANFRSQRERCLSGMG